MCRPAHGKLRLELYVAVTRFGDAAHSGKKPGSGFGATQANPLRDWIITEASMVKGLLIRQAFFLIDLVLAILLAFVVYKIADRQLERGPVAPPTVDISDSSGAPLKVAKVGPLDEYKGIGSSGLFGSAGDTSVPDVALTEVNTVPPPPTLKLHATAASPDPGDPLSTAIIENSAAPTVQKLSTYYHGQPVTDQLYLVEVYPRKVILENRKEKTKSELAMEDATEEKPQGTSAAMARNQIRRPVQLAQNTANTVSLDRNAVAEELASYDYASVVNTLNPEMAEDGNGNVVGITSSNFSSVPLAKEIGLQNGDVVNTVNGIKIDSDQKLMEIFTKFSNANTFRLGVTRNGSPTMLTFKLE